MNRASAQFTSGSNLMRWALASILAVIVLLFLAGKIAQDSNTRSLSSDEIKIYCAAGIADTLQAVVQEFNRAHEQVAIIERIGGSGELAGQIKSELETKVKTRADILISNDDLLFQRPEFSNCFESFYPLAKQRPVIAVLTGKSKEPGDLNELVNGSGGKFGVASERAAIGALTRKLALRLGILETLEQRKSLDAENVMVLAQALVIGSLDAAVIWDTTVIQINSQQGKQVLKIAGDADIATEAASNTVIGLVKQESGPMERNSEFVKFLQSKRAAQILESAGYIPANSIAPDVSVSGHRKTDE